MMFGNGSMMGYAWLWILGAIALIVLVIGLAMLVLARPTTNTGRNGMLRLGGPLALLGLVAILALGGMTIGGWLPHAGQVSAGPGSAGFVAGTEAAPRVVRITAGPGFRFYPDVVPIATGETITFEVTTMGLTAHEFMVGPAADVAADKEGTPEVADIGMMQTQSLTYTFAGSGPFAFACHVTGHYEAGMKGSIVIQP